MQNQLHPYFKLSNSNCHTALVYHCTCIVQENNSILYLLMHLCSYHNMKVAIKHQILLLHWLCHFPLCALIGTACICHATPVRLLQWHFYERNSSKDEGSPLCYLYWISCEGVKNSIVKEYWQQNKNSIKELTWHDKNICILLFPYLEQLINTWKVVLNIVFLGQVFHKTSQQQQHMLNFCAEWKYCLYI